MYVISSHDVAELQHSTNITASSAPPPPKEEKTPAESEAKTQDAPEPTSPPKPPQPSESEKKADKIDPPKPKETKTPKKEEKSEKSASPAPKPVAGSRNETRVRFFVYGVVDKLTIGTGQNEPHASPHCRAP
jgi:hypothetical protein